MGRPRPQLLVRLHPDNVPVCTVLKVSALSAATTHHGQQHSTSGITGCSPVSRDQFGGGFTAKSGRFHHRRDAAKGLCTTFASLEEATVPPMTNGILKLLMRREEEELAIRHGWEK